MLVVIWPCHASHDTHMNQLLVEHIPHGEDRHGIDGDERSIYAKHYSGEWVMSHMKEWAEEHIPHGETRHGFDCDEQCSHVAHYSGEWVMSHIWKSEPKNIFPTGKKKRHGFDCNSDVVMSRIIVVNESWLASHVTHINEILVEHILLKGSAWNCWRWAM